MDISLNWLEEWVDLSGIEEDELAHRLTMAGLEVDAVESFGREVGEIVVGEIGSIEPHPEADRLVMCEVDVGRSGGRRIACGAENMEVGDRVPVALPGSRPPAVEFEVTERELMGEVSEGMLCSAEELGIEEESAGLWILPDDLEIGADVFDALDLRDTRFEFDLTPNRSDCLSHLGVAREVSAIWERPLRSPDEAGEAPIWERTEAERNAGEVASLTVADPEGCPRYAFGVVESVEVGPSPFWLQRRLASVGIRSVNNVVDVTNYVLMDVGQPLHAFDLDELRGPEIEVRRARSGESLEAIDHETYELSEDDLVIADAERPVALAGVMGGAATEVGESTDRVLLECAFFDPVAVRRASKRHGLHTESSHRFERRIDPAGVEPYMDRALRCLRRSQPGGAARVLRGIALESTGGAAESWTVELPDGESERILGSQVDGEDVRGSLERLGLEVESGEGGWRVEVPTHRGDLRRSVDLVEEVARMYGYGRVPDALPTREMGGAHERRADGGHPPTLESRRDRNLRRRARDRLLDAGLREVVTPSFMAADSLDELGVVEGDERRNLVEISNPLRESERYLQTTLIPGLLDVLVSNRAQKRRDVAIFEFGRRYFPDGESPTLGLLLAGRAVHHWSERRDWDFYDLKGLVESIGAPWELGATNWREADGNRPWLHPGVGAIWSAGKELAEAGRLHPEILQELEVEGPVLVAEVDWEAVTAHPVEASSFDDFSAHPPVDRDLAVVVDEEISYRQIADTIDSYRRSNAEFDALVESVELFDVYRGPQVEDDERSMAFSVRYRAPDRTLTEDEVAPLEEGLADWLREKLGAERR